MLETYTVDNLQESKKTTQKAQTILRSYLISTAWQGKMATSSLSAGGGGGGGYGEE